MTNLWLEWYRDKDRGQEASNATSADETMDGTWPIARIYFLTIEGKNRMWKWLLDTYGVNAMSYTYYTGQKVIF